MCLPGKRHKQLLYCTSFTLKPFGLKIKRKGKLKGKWKTENAYNMIECFLYMFKIRAAAIFCYSDLFRENLNLNFFVNMKS